MQNWIATGMMNNRYYYSKLNEEEQYVYNAIARAVDCGNDNVTFRTNLTVENICVVHTYAFNDNPSWFTVSPQIGFSYRGNEYNFNFKRIYSDVEKQNAESFFKTVAQMVTEKCKGKEDYKKALYIAKIFLEKCTYGFPNGENGSIKSQLATSVAVDSKSVCAGLARAFKYVCDLIGIECIVVSGDTIRNIVPKTDKDKENVGNETVDVYKALRNTYTSVADKVSGSSKINYIPHAWNMAKLNGKWFVIDLNATQNVNKDYVFRNLYNFCIPESELVGYVWNRNITPK